MTVMTDDTFDDSTVDEDVRESIGFKNLRAAYDKQREQLAAVRREAEKLRVDNRNTSLSGVLKAKGVSEKVAQFYPADNGVDEASVSKWLEENADVFGPKTPPAAQADESPNADQARRVAEAANSAFGTVPTGLDEVQNKIKALDPRDPKMLENLTNIMATYSPPI